MNKQVKRRQFIKTSALGFGGLFAMCKGTKKSGSQLDESQGNDNLELTTNNWSLILQEDQGARRFSSFRYAPDINCFLLWGFHGYYSGDYGNPEKPWSGNKEYDIVAFNPVTGSWENHLPHGKLEEWRKSLPPMHHVNTYQGITPGYYRPQLKERSGVLRPDLNIVGDQVTYDSKRRRMVYFTGGRTFAYHVEERIWSSIDGDQAPPPVSFGSLCYDPFGDRIILYGGGHVAEPDTEGRLVGYTGTWEYNCKTGNWSPVSTGGDSPPRMCTRLVCDTRKKVIVVFGGDGQSHFRAYTWILDLRRDTWRKSTSAGVPEARAGHFAVYNRPSGLVIMGGGYNYEELTDMWGYDVASDSWHRLRGETSVGWYVTADIIPDSSIILLTTSKKREGDTHGCNEIYPVRTTYAYQIEKQGLADETAVPGPERELPKRPVKQVIEGTEPDAVRYREQMTRIQKMPGNQWVHFDKPGRLVPVRTWGSCAFDTDKGRIIYWGGGHCGYGGNENDFYDVEQNTWVSSPIIAEYPERAWDKGIIAGGVTFSGGPWIRHGRKIYAYDPVSRKIINTKTVYLTGDYNPEPLKDIEPKKIGAGTKENFSPSYYTKWGTWVYHEESQKWEIICCGLTGLDLLVQTPKGVMAVDYNWGAFDSKQRADMTTWNGETIMDNSVYLLDVAGRQWKKLTLKGPWPQNLYEMTALVYDSHRDQLILHGAGPKQDELWRFPLKTGQWEKIEPDFATATGGQPPVCRREAAYLPDDDMFLTAGSPEGDRSRSGIWAYHVGENRWYKRNIEPPEGRTMNDMLGQNRAWAYDPIHDIVFMIIGANDAGEALIYRMKFA